MKVFKQKIEFDFVDTSKVDIELVITESKSELIHTLKLPYAGFETREFIISGNELNSYIESWEYCFYNMEKYKKMMKNIHDGNLKIASHNGLIINVSKNGSYVALTYYYWDHFKVYTHEQLNEVLSKYKYIKIKIKEVQKMMRSGNK